MLPEIAPYILLLNAIIVGWWFETRISALLAALAIVAALFSGTMALAGLGAIALLGVAIWMQDRISNVYGRIFAFLFLLGMVGTLFLHVMPGFWNLLIFNNIFFSPQSALFTMYLNFDKTVCGLLIYLFLVKPVQVKLDVDTWIKHSSVTLLVLLLVMVPMAVASGYIEWDPKIPQQGWVWMLNNLFFVCFAEETIFRGFIQRKLQSMLPNGDKWSYVAIGMAALLFGLTHIKGGILYIGLVTVAGCFYGYAYKRVGHLAAPMAVHFGLNLMHFLFFTYPAARSSFG